MELNDIMTLKALGGTSDHSSYETFMISDKLSKKASGTSIAALTVGGVGLLAGIGAWVFAGVTANAKARAAREAANTAITLANANHTNTLALINQGQANTNATLDRMLEALRREQDQRIAGDVTLTNTVNDSVSGSQQGTLTAQQAAELSSIQSVQNTLLTDAITGRSSLNPTPVTVYSAPQPCACPGCGN